MTTTELIQNGWTIWSFIAGAVSFTVWATWKISTLVAELKTLKRAVAEHVKKYDEDQNTLQIEIDHIKEKYQNSIDEVKKDVNTVKEILAGIKSSFDTFLKLKQ